MRLLRMLPAFCRDFPVVPKRLFTSATLIAVLAAFGATRAEAMGNSSTVLRANPAPATYGQSVTLNATVLGGVAEAIAGSVEFFDGATSLNPGGTATIAVAPVQLYSINEHHACDLGSDGNITDHSFRTTTRCWGDNSYGQIGDGSTTFRAAPAPANDLTSLIVVAAGLHFTCALGGNNNGSNGIRCWGDNSKNQLGQGSSNQFEASPVPVQGAFSGMVALASGGFHSCGISATDISDTSGGGPVVCWGDNAYGQLGDTTQNTTSAAVVSVSGISNAIAIATGHQHSCALLSDGTVKCWGNNSYGQIGSGASVDSALHATPVAVPGITSATAIATTKNHTCVALSDGTAKCWGANDRKQLGDGNGGNANDKSATPVTVLNVGDAVTVAAGYAHSCVVRSNGVASCWGDNQFGQLGNSSSSASPQDIVNVTGLAATSLIAGGNSTCAGNQAGELQCWGHDVALQADHNVPTTITIADGGAPVRLQARISISSLKADTHSITAVFTPTRNDIQPSTSNSVSLYVQGLASTTTVTADQSPIHLGDDATFSVSVSGANGPAGNGAFPLATLKVDGNSVDVQSVVSGAVTLTATGLAVGTHTVQVFFAGDDVYAPSQSEIINQVVKGDTTVALLAAPNSVTLGQAAGFTATVAATAPAMNTPTGSVTFKDGTKTLGSSTLNGAGVASLNTSGLNIGSRNIAAYYDGDDNLFGSTSNTANITVSAFSGSEGQANATATGAQNSPAVAALAKGYVVVWSSNGQDGSGYGVYGQRYKANGAADGAEFHISTTTKGAQSAAKVARITSGFVVVWQSDKQDKSGTGIYAQRYNAKGVAQSTEFKVNTTTAGNQSQPAVAGLDDGGYVIVWTSDGQDGAGLGIYGQRYDNKGKAAGTEFLVNTTTAGDQSAPSVAGLAGGGFFVAWQGPDASGLGIYAQRFAATGAKSGSELKVNTVTTNDQSLPSVGALANGGAVIAWQSALQDGSGLGVYAQVYKSTGAKQGANKLVNTTTTNDQGAPAVAGFTDAGYAIAWISKLQDGSGQGIYAQVFDPTGKAVNVEFRVNTTTAGDQVQPAAAAFSGGSFVVLWTSPDANGTGIFQQRLTVPQPSGG